jgi:hypothetical protein
MIHLFFLPLMTFFLPGAISMGCGAIIHFCMGREFNRVSLLAMLARSFFFPPRDLVPAVDVSVNYVFFKAKSQGAVNSMIQENL